MLRDAKSVEQDKSEAKKAIETLNSFVQKIKLLAKSKITSASDDKVSNQQAKLSQMVIQNAMGLGFEEFEMKILSFLNNTRLIRQSIQGFKMADAPGSPFDLIENFKQYMQELIIRQEEEDIADDDIQQKSSEKKDIILKVIEIIRSDLMWTFPKSAILERSKNDIIKSLETPAIKYLLSKDYNLDDIKKAFETLFTIYQRYENQLILLKKQFIEEHEPKKEELPVEKPTLGLSNH